MLINSSKPQQPENYVISDNELTNVVTLSSGTKTFKNSSSYYFPMGKYNGNGVTNYDVSFSIKFIPTSSIILKNGTVVLKLNNELFKNQINFFKNADDLLLNNKNNLLDELIKNGFNTHPDLYVHIPLVSSTKNHSFININMVKSSTLQIVTKFIFDDDNSVKVTNFDEALTEYNKYDYTNITFRMMSKFSKNGDKGIRSFSVILSTSSIQFTNKNNSNLNKDSSNEQITSIEI